MNYQIKSINTKLKLIIILLPLLLFFKSYAFCSSVQGSKVYKVKIDIESLETALKIFTLDFKRLPSNEEGLKALIDSNGFDNRWRGPYTERNSIPLDAWNNEYKYIYPSKFGNKQYDLYSVGIDGLDNLGENDDISNWNNFNDRYYKIRYDPLATLLWIIIASIPTSFLISAKILSIISKKKYKLTLPYVRALLIELAIMLTFSGFLFLIISNPILFFENYIIFFLNLIVSIILIGTPFYGSMIKGDDNVSIGIKKGSKLSLTIGLLRFIILIIIIIGISIFQILLSDYFY